MALFDWFDRLITEHGSAAVQKTHIDMLRDQTQALEKENVELKKRVAEFEDQLRKATAELQTKRSAEEYVRHRGVLFRRLPDGSYEDGVYCHICQGPMFSMANITPFACSRCDVTAGFTGRDLSRVLGELKKNYG